MRSLKHCFIFIVFIPFQNIVSAQSYIIRDIKSFGAKGDGKTNDHKAFQKAAAYFNSRGGNGKLIISKGVYIVGEQPFSGGKANKSAYEGEDVLHFRHVKNLKISGTINTIIRYKDSLRFGSFYPATGIPYEHNNKLFRTGSYAAFIGSCFNFDSCSYVSVSGLTLDGNNKGIILGGSWGDAGRQLPHYGIFIQYSNNVTVDKVNVHHFGLDGICVANKNNLSERKDSIKISNSSFQYNSRQGLSWVGGNDLVAENCQFNNTGKGAFASAPSAGVDIETDLGPIKNGRFINCEFNNNKGLGLVADAGDSRDCTFASCTFWGATSWSIWVTKPGFTFNDCKIYGSIVHGYNSPDQKSATKFVACTFEDKLYEGKEPYGNFLIETNNAKRMSFIDCKFIANRKMLCWMFLSSPANPEEKYQLTNCSFTLKNDSFQQNLVGALKGAVLKNCTFNFKTAGAKKKGLAFIKFKDGENIDLGGNKLVYPGEVLTDKGDNVQ